MEKKILLISSQTSFMVNAMIKNLNNEGYDVVQAQPKVVSVKRDENSLKIVLLYVDTEVDEIMDFLVYLKDMLTENGDAASVYIVGNDEEINSVFKIIPERLLAGTFHRPLNVKDLVEHLNEGMENAVKERKKHILVVDDDATMLRTIKLWLSERYSVYMANSGMNAIQLLAKNEVDLILLDYEMPVVSGPQVLEMIRNEPTTRDTPVMFLTARNDKESVMSVMDLKPEKYLLKTMAPDDLMASIDEFFELQKGKK